MEDSPRHLRSKAYLAVELLQERIVHEVLEPEVYLDDEQLSDGCVGSVQRWTRYAQFGRDSHCNWFTEGDAESGDGSAGEEQAPDQRGGGTIRY